MVCFKCRHGAHDSCPSVNRSKTACDCQHLSGLVNWVGLELEAREQAKESSSEGEQEDTS